MSRSPEVRKCLGSVPAIKRRLPSEKEVGAISAKMKLLSHPTRLRILRILAEGDQCVCVFSEVLGKKQPNISQHLAKLKDNQIIDSYCVGKLSYYTLKDKRIKRYIKPT